MCSISNHERKIIRRFLATLRKPDYALDHCLSFDDDHPKIGEFRQNQMCVWFRKEGAVEDCVAILRSIPTRSVEFTVSEMCGPLAAILRPVNYRILRGPDLMLVSAEANHQTLQAARDFGE